MADIFFLEADRAVRWRRIFDHKGIDFRPIYLHTDGRLYLQFGSWEGRPVFGSLENRSELVKRFGAVNNANFDDMTLKKYPSLSLRRILRDPDGPSKILGALKWMEKRITDAGRLHRLRKIVHSIGVTIALMQGFYCLFPAFPMRGPCAEPFQYSVVSHDFDA